MTLSPSRGAPNPRSSSPSRAARLRPALDDRRRRLDAGLRLARAGRRAAAQPGQLGAGQVAADPLLAWRPAPRARPAPRGSRRSRPRGRSPRPRSSSRIRVVTRSSTWRSWETSTSPPRCTARRSSSQAMASMSRWFVGSSRISSTSSPASPGGPTSTRARARATRLASPPDSVAVGSSRRPPRSRRSRIAAASQRPTGDVADRRPGERRVLVEHDDPASRDPDGRRRPRARRARRAGAAASTCRCR